MASAGDPTPPDFDLSTRLARRGVYVTPSTLHHWRSEGHIAGPQVVDGRKLAYSPEVETYAAELKTAMARHKKLNLSALSLFGQGVDPTEKALKNAYISDVRGTQRTLLVVAASARTARKMAAAFARKDTGPTQRAFRRAGASEEETDDIAVAIVSTIGSRFVHSNFGRTLHDRLRRLTTAPADEHDPPSSVIRSVVGELSRIALTGSATSEEALEELFAALGISAIQWDSWREFGPIVGKRERLVTPELLRVIAGYRLDRLVDRIDRASIEELRSARDHLTALLDLFDDAATFMRFMTPLQDAFSFAAFSRLMSIADRLWGKPLVVGRYAPMMLVIKDEVSGYEENVAEILAMAPNLHAAATFVRILPREYQRPYGFRRWEKLGRDERQRLVSRWERLYPAEAASVAESALRSSAESEDSLAV